ncbi:hypothetical protein V3C99_012528 [Haemonchus contortus]
MLVHFAIKEGTERMTAGTQASMMKAVFLAVALLAISAIAFAEEQKKELSEEGLAVLNQLQELRKEEDDALAAIDDENERALISKILDKEEDEADKLEETKETTRVKRAVRRRGRRAGRARAARRRFLRRLRRNQRRAAQKRRAHARRHRKNQRRAAAKIRRIQQRG